VSGRTIRIATRASPLALWQARHVSGLLEQCPGVSGVELVHVSTQGDRDRSEPLRQFGGLGVFTREVQSAVLEQRADLAVHSLKDLPTRSEPGLTLSGIPARGPVLDVLVLRSSSPGTSLDDLPAAARVGTGSPRRQAQLKHAREDLDLREIRGNIETRLRKLDEGEYDAIVLAEAGLVRLGREDRISVRLAPPLMFPAVAQGALGLECRADDAGLMGWLAELSDRETFAAATAERELLAELRAGCHAPLGAFSRIDDRTLTLEAVVLSLDGRERLHAECSGTLDEPLEVGRELAALLRAEGVDRLLNP
jgi:hydroxymethylbilane synthase